LLLVALGEGGDERHRRLAREAAFDALLFTPAAPDILRRTLVAVGEAPDVKLLEERVP